MAKSAKQIEQEVLAFLETIGESASGFKDVSELKGMEKAIILSAANFIIRVRENLKRLNKIDTGALSSDITEGELIDTGDGYEISVGYPKESPAAGYYDFINKGVKGFVTNEPADSPYSYKNIRNKRGGVLIGKKFQKSILDWYGRHQEFAKREDQRYGKSPLQRKRKRLSKMVDESKNLKSLAYATAVKIKQKGIKKTGFFDDAINYQFGTEFLGMIQRITGKEIAINIKNYGDNNR
jgi:hypothetical protein